MIRARRQLEPEVAARRAFDALLEAGRYSGYGTTTVITRLGRRVAVAGAEGSHRTGVAWSALRGRTPPRPRNVAGAAATVAAATVGAIAATLAVRHVLVSWRATDPEAEFTPRMRSALWPAGPDAGARPSAAVDAADEPAPSPTAYREP
jgi:hypothetical protein